MASTPLRFTIKFTGKTSGGFDIVSDFEPHEISVPAGVKLAVISCRIPLLEVHEERMLSLIPGSEDRVPWRLEQCRSA